MRATGLVLFAKTLVLSLPPVFAQPNAVAAPIRAPPPEGPYDSPQRPCGRLRKAVCDCSCLCP